MTITIGRFQPGSDCYVQTWGSDGDKLTVTGLTSATQATAISHRQQILGLALNPDELVVPVTYSPDPTVDGFYRVTGSSVSTDKIPAGKFPWSIDLERLPGYGQSLVQVKAVGTVRTNTSAITSATAKLVFGVTAAATEFYDSVDNVSFARTADDGDLILTSSGTYDRFQVATISPANYYKSSAYLKAGSPAQYVVGHQVPASQTNVDWELGNGLIRVHPGATEGLSVERYDGSAWDTARVFLPQAEDCSVGCLLGVPVRVLRNSPEEVVIRLAPIGSAALTTATSSVRFRMTLDLALRRGDRMVRCVAAGTTPVRHGIENLTATASTAITAGIRATSASNGDRFVFASPNASTNDLVQGTIRATANADTYRYAFGFEIGAGSAATNDTAANLVLQYMVAGSERQSVVAR